MKGQFGLIHLPVTIVDIVIHSLSYVWLFATPGSVALLSSTISWSLPRFMSIELVMLSNHLILCHPLSFCLQFFPASRSFPMSQFFASGGQSIEASTSASVLPMNIEDWFTLGWTGLTPCSIRESQGSSPTPQFKSINSSAFTFLYGPTLTTIHNYGKTIALTRWTLLVK